MESREQIMKAAISLIEEKGDRLEEITVREISRRAGVGLGLVNYHFGSKEELIRLCVERIINGIVDTFRRIEGETRACSPFENLEYLGNMTFEFLFAHEAVSRISILSDLMDPKPDDNTNRTCRAYLPLISACRPDWDEQTVKEKTFTLIAVMQQSFLRHEMVKNMLGLDLREEEMRRVYHRRVLDQLLER